MFFIPVAAALEASLDDPGTLEGDWSDSIQEGSTDSARSFLAFIGYSMLEQSFTLQHAPLPRSAGMNGQDGLAIGFELDSFPFGKAPVNGQGKVENTKFLPFIPRITASYLHRDTLSYGAGLSLTPPVSVQGASALLVGVDASVAYVLRPWLSLGLELDATAGQAYAPVVATPEQKAAGVLENADEERYESICVPQDYGCIDSLLIRHGGAHLSVIFPINDAIYPWIKLGGGLIDDRFLVQVDLSDWHLKGFLPDLSVGASISPWEHLHFGVGAMLAPVPEGLKPSSESPLLYRFSLQASLIP